MGTQVFNEFKRASAAGEVDLNADDIRAKLVMTDTTVDTENDGIVNLDDFTDIDEFNGTNYTVKALASETVTKDDGNDRAIFDADDLTYSSLEAGDRSIAGLLIYKHVDGTDANDGPPICFLEKSGTPDGNDFVVQFNATTGILTLS